MKHNVNIEILVSIQSDQRYCDFLSCLCLRVFHSGEKIMEKIMDLISLNAYKNPVTNNKISSLMIRSTAPIKAFFKDGM